MSRRVLVVDDDPEMVDTLADVLELHGWEVERAADGQEAVERCQERAFAAVVMDVRMPRLDGPGAMRAMHARSPGLPVLLVTAMAAPDVLQQAAADGAYCILEKPLNPEVLVTVLSSAVSDGKGRAP